MNETLPGQVVLVLQGGGALGAYQVGVYQALHEAGIEPEWVIGTSIGAINGAIIAGNAPDDRIARLDAFWDRVRRDAATEAARWFPALDAALTNLGTFTHGIDGFFHPNPQALRGVHAPLGVENAAFYLTAPLGETLAELVDFGRINGAKTRLSLGAVSVSRGDMHYFDSREMAIGPKHVMASGALPPAFPAVRIDGEPYWDGGIYSNTPVEAVLDDRPRRDSVIFSVNVWDASGPEPESIWQVLGRQKEIQYASRAKSHLARQDQLHRLRHVIRALVGRIPEAERDAEVREFASFGCGTTIHLVRFTAPRLDGEDHTKDIDFTAAGIRARRAAGYAATRRMIERAPWREPCGTLDGILVHE
jgi:NTE family protein